MRDKIMALVCSHFYPQTCEYITLQGKRDFTEVIERKDFKTEKFF